jgi:hypothetical protein
MEWGIKSITVSVEDSGKYIQITKPGASDSSCNIKFRPEQVQSLNQILLDARKKALELQDPGIKMGYEGGPVS